MAKKEKFDYFDSFIELTDLAVQEADLLIRAIDEYTTPENLKPHMDEAHELERRGDAINHKVYSNIATDFITPIEREDLVGLAQHLDDVLDDLENVMQCFYMYNINHMHEGVTEFAALIKQSCVSLQSAMKNFRNFKKSKDYKQYIVAVNDCEEQGDALYLKTIRNLFTTCQDKPLVAHVWSEIFDRLEKCLDATEHVADVMSTVLLKNS